MLKKKNNGQIIMQKMYYNGFVILHISNYGSTSNENGEIRIGSRENYLVDFSINNCFHSHF